MEVSQDTIDTDSERISGEFNCDFRDNDFTDEYKN